MSREFEDFMLTWFIPRKSEVFIDVGAHVVAREPEPPNLDRRNRKIGLFRAP